ncbi:MAG TPA: branched-chain amino acid ABC transporter permease [Alphaproteobacteria bacterium]|nr:branched-chain amino acid ABC transporter permease [Alphaproteobacteria bacterium]
MVIVQQKIDWKKLFGQACIAALIGALLFFHLIGLPTVQLEGKLTVEPNWLGFSLAVVSVFILRLGVGALGGLRLPSLKIPAGQKFYTQVMIGLLAAAIILPFTPLSNRYVLDVLTLIFTYMVLACGLNIVVGLTGLLDLGFVAFYAIGAYSFSLLALKTGLSFWQALPFSILLAALAAFVLGLIVLRLRGDYLAIVTLGFAEILRIVLLNWTMLTNGPNGLTGIPRPQFFGLTFEPAQRVLYLYYLAILFFVGVMLFTQRLRRLPLGRAFEAVREDELAAQAMGINLTRTRLTAYVLAACCGALAGAFFATRQGFVSPESFTFVESGLVLAIVVLAGMGHPLGIMLGAAFLVGLPEVFRSLQDYRLIAFGAGMVLIMIWRPEGLFALRPPAVTLPFTNKDST